MSDQWCELIRNYREIHKDEFKDRERREVPLCKYEGHEPGKTGWSRHLYEPDEVGLADGTLCFAKVDDSVHPPRLEALYPVTISRKLHEIAPQRLLHESLQPASSLSELSPADRVFGWVNQQGGGAYRGNLRVSPVSCETGPVKPFPEGKLPLAILGQPKPQQTRFYVAMDQRGEPQDDRISGEQAGYRDGKGLRGRKVYPHHRDLPDGYWQDPTTDHSQEAVGNHYREYRRPEHIDSKDKNRTRDTQNRSVEGWVEPGTVFSFDLQVSNLSEVELGALLWLLTRPDDHFHRFGGGKPLGFGSVHLSIRDLDLCDGAARAEWYRGFGEGYGNGRRWISEKEAEGAITSYQGAVEAAYGNGSAFGEVPFIAAFLRSMTGFDDGLPVRYPRTRHAGDGVPPNPEGKSFEWFVENEREERLALPALWRDGGGLPHHRHT